MAILPDFAIFVTEHTFEMNRPFPIIPLAAMLLPKNLCTDESCELP